MQLLDSEGNIAEGPTDMVSMAVLDDYKVHPPLAFSLCGEILIRTRQGPDRVPIRQRLLMHRRVLPRECGVGHHGLEDFDDATDA